MKIKSIKNANVKGYFKLEIDTGEGVVLLFVSASQLEALGKSDTGDEISSEELKFLKSGDEYNRAKKKALNILSFGDNSARELKMKLARQGFSKDTVERIILEMEKLGYVNEARQLLRLVENEVNLKLSGPKKIVAKLSSKGYASADIKSAISELEAAGKIDFSAVKQRLTAKAADSEEKRKILYKHGFY